MVLATDRVAYWAHWITPEERPIRYDTRFFVAATWPEQVAEPDGLEMVAARWIRPEDALARHRARELVLPLPTQGILASLSAHRDVDALLAAAHGREVRPVRPAHHPGREWRRAHPAPAGSWLVLRPGPRHRIG